MLPSTAPVRSAKFLPLFCRASWYLAIGTRHLIGWELLPQVGHRKQALDLLAAAFLSGGRSAAFEVFSRLPHNEAGFAGFDAARAAAELGVALA